MESAYDEIIMWIKIIYSVMAYGPFKYKLFIISSFFVVIGGLNVTLIFPIIFNYFLIPNIEKKLGKKICYPEFLKQLPSRYYSRRYVLVASHIARAYLLYVFKGDKSVYKRGVLTPLNYTIDMASKVEIFFSLMNFMNRYLIIFGLIGIFVASGQLKLFL